MGQKGKGKPSRKLVWPRALGRSCLGKPGCQFRKVGSGQIQNRKPFRMVSGGGQWATLCPKGLGDIALERTEGICFVAKYNLDMIFCVSHCCFAESMIEVKSVPGL